jgi:3-hydroxyisobutyrate dehydrogenase
MENKNLKIGWIGTGVMGKSMAEHLINKGYNDIYVFNRTASKADGLVKLGAKYMESPIAVAKEVDVLFLMLGYP